MGFSGCGLYDKIIIIFFYIKTTKGVDQSAHSHSLISTTVVRCMPSLHEKLHSLVGCQPGRKIFFLFTNDTIARAN